MQRECENRLTSHLCNFLIIDGPPENSSTIDRAGPARSKSDEFSGGPSIVHELDSQIALETVKNMLHLLGPGVFSPERSGKMAS